MKSAPRQLSEQGCGEVVAIDHLYGDSQPNSKTDEQFSNSIQS